jgi:hypothetical protein
LIGLLKDDKSFVFHSIDTNGESPQIESFSNGKSVPESSEMPTIQLVGEIEVILGGDPYFWVKPDVDLGDIAELAVYPQSFDPHELSALFHHLMLPSAVELTWRMTHTRRQSLNL